MRIFIFDRLLRTRDLEILYIKKEPIRPEQMDSRATGDPCPSYFSKVALDVFLIIWNHASLVLGNIAQTKRKEGVRTIIIE